MVAIHHLSPGHFQPRRIFTEEGLTELIASIGEKGVLQPLLIRAHPNQAQKFEIIAGERRWRAAKQAGLTHVPAMIKNFSDREALEVALVENLQRENLSPLEEAEAYKRLMAEFSHTQDDLAKSLGKSRSHIANTIRLLSLPDEVKSLLDQQLLSPGHARALLTARNPVELAHHIADNNLTVRDAERLVQQEKDHPQILPDSSHVVYAPSSRHETSHDEEGMRYLAQQLSQILGVPVSVSPKKHGGEIRIRYSSEHQFRRILEAFDPIRNPTAPMVIP